MDGGFCHYCRKAVCICDDDKAIAKEFGEMSADLPDREPSVEELRRLREAAPLLDENIIQFVSTAACGCSACASSCEYVAYAANHALTLLDRLRAVNEGLVGELKEANGWRKRLEDREQMVHDLGAEYAKPKLENRELRAELSTLRETCRKLEEAERKRQEDVERISREVLAEARVEVDHEFELKSQLADQSRELEALRAANLKDRQSLTLLSDECLKLHELCSESNEVCVCGCPADAHESYGEDGEGCSIEGHECVRTCIAVLGMLEDARAEAWRLKEERDSFRRVLERETERNRALVEALEEAKMWVTNEETRARMVKLCDARDSNA